MVRQQRHEGRHALFQAYQESPAIRLQPIDRVVGLPEVGEPLPLRVRVDRIAHGAAGLDANPRHGMRVVDIEPEDKRAGQAHDTFQPDRRGNAEPRDRPEVGDDLGDPALPLLPGLALVRPFALQALQDRAQRVHQVEQGRALVANLVDQRRGDAAADHAFARDADDARRIAAAAGQAGARPADCSADAAIEVADDRGHLVVAARQREASAETTSSPESQTQVSFSLRWEDARRVKRSNSRDRGGWVNLSLRKVERDVAPARRLDCLAAGPAKPFEEVLNGAWRSWWRPRERGGARWGASCVSGKETGVWLSGLDVVSADALSLPGGYYEVPRVICSPRSRHRRCNPPGAHPPARRGGVRA